MNTSDFTNPEIFGPGVWFVLHTMAIKCATGEDKSCFEVLVADVRENMKCMECKMHMRHFLSLEPLSAYRDQPQGYFYWSWLFHNEVNRRLNKPQPSYDDAYNYYANKGGNVCTNCHGKIGNKNSSHHEDRSTHRSVITSSKSTSHNDIKRSVDRPSASEHKTDNQRHARSKFTTRRVNRDGIPCAVKTYLVSEANGRIPRGSLENEHHHR